MIQALTVTGFLLTITILADANVAALLQWFSEANLIVWVRVISMPPLSFHTIFGLMTTSSYGNEGFQWFSFLLCLLYLAISWYGWRRWSDRRRSGGDKSRLRTNEREFIVPFASRPDRFEQTDSEDEP